MYANDVEIYIEDHGDEVAISSPYSEYFLKYLREEIPQGDYRWEKSSKLWYVNADHYDVLEDIVTRCWPDADITVY